MEQYVGVSQDQTSICVVDGNGRVLWQGKSASTPDMMCIPTKSATGLIGQLRPEAGHRTDRISARSGC